MAAGSRLNFPPLESGDRLPRHEFEQRYAASPHIHKAELIEGVVYVASPVRVTQHSRPHAVITAWLSAYWLATPGVDLQLGATLRLDLDNEPQPDALLRIEPGVGGQSSIDDDDFIGGAPELIAEVATSSVSYDLTDKLNAYRRNGVQDYIVWQTYENQVSWLTLRQGDYVPVEPDDNGIIRSTVFPGLWLAVDALREGDRAGLAAVLQEGLQTSDHQAFAKRINPDNRYT